MLFKFPFLLALRRFFLSDPLSRKRYWIECIMYNIYAIFWLGFTIYVWITWHRQGATFKLIASLIDIFGIPVGLSDTWSFKKWLIEEEKQKNKVIS
jgi:hypothetical protein